MNKEPVIINIDNEFKHSVEEAGKLFVEGKVFVYPTDTLYGIGGNPFDKSVVSRINRIKKRNQHKQFILLVNDIRKLNDYVEFQSASHVKSLKDIWPGPVSVIFRTNSNFLSEFGTSTVAFRIPDNKFCLTLLERIQKPLISTSANKADEKTSVDLSEISNKFSTDVDAVFYTKTSPNIIPSTIIDLTEREPKLIREGRIKFVDLLRKFN